MMSLQPFLFLLVPLLILSHPLELSPANCTNSSTLQQVVGTYHAYQITVEQEHMSEFTGVVVTCSPDMSIASVCEDVVLESLSDVKVSVNGTVAHQFVGSFHQDRKNTRLSGSLSLAHNQLATLACVTPLTNGNLTSLTTDITSEQSFSYEIHPPRQTVLEKRGFRLTCTAGTENEINLAVWGAWNGTVGHETEIQCEEKMEHNGLGFRCEMDKRENNGVWESRLTVFGDSIEGEMNIIFWCGHRGSFPVGVGEAMVTIKPKGHGFWIGLGVVAILVVIVSIGIAIKILIKRSRLSTVMTYAKLDPDADADPALGDSTFSIS